MIAALVCVGPDAPRIIPLPRDWRVLEGVYELPQRLTIGYRGDGAEDIAHYLSGMHTKGCIAASLIPLERNAYSCDGSAM